MRKDKKKNNLDKFDKARMVLSHIDIITDTPSLESEKKEYEVECSVHYFNSIFDKQLSLREIITMVFNERLEFYETNYDTAFAPFSEKKKEKFRFKCRGALTGLDTLYGENVVYPHYRCDNEVLYTILRFIQIYLSEVGLSEGTNNFNKFLDEKEPMGKLLADIFYKNDRRTNSLILNVNPNLIFTKYFKEDILVSPSKLLAKIDDEESPKISKANSVISRVLIFLYAIDPEFIYKVPYDQLHELFSELGYDSEMETFQEHCRDIFQQMKIDKRFTHK